MVNKRIDRPEHFNVRIERKVKRISELSNHADNIYHSRFNFFMIAESMFILSFVTSVASVIDKDLSLMYFLFFPIIFLGLCFSLAWLYTNARLAERIHYLIRRRIKIDNVFWDYINSVEGIYSGAFLSFFLPIIFTLFWWYLFVYLLVGNHWLTSFVVLFHFGLLLIAIAVYIHFWIPNYDEKSLEVKDC